MRISSWTYGGDFSSSDVLLNHHSDDQPVTSEFSIVADEGALVIVGSAHDHNAPYPDGDFNEYGGGHLPLEPQELAEGLIAAKQGANWSRDKEGVRWFFNVRSSYGDSGGISMSIGESHYGPTADVALGKSRTDMLLLDTYEAVFCGPRQARSGMQLPADSLDAAFLEALRANPQHLAQLKTVGLERTILGILNERAGDAVHLERLGPDANLLLARPRGGGRGAMLLYVEPSTSDVVNINVVDRINGIRDRDSVTKAAIVTRSHFSADAEKAYQGRSDRMELVDFDRLSGLLTDGGWIAHSSNYLALPVAERPPHAVFISYNQHQRPFAKWLHDRLHGWQYNCFLDQVDMAPGDIILSGVQKALEGADVVVLCCSSSALASKWVQTEIGICLEKEKRSGRKILIPVRLDDSRFDGELAALNDRVTLDFRGWERWRPGDDDGLAGLIGAIDGVIQQGASS
jgi:TIR domain-containing protein